MIGEFEENARRPADLYGSPVSGISGAVAPELGVLRGEAVAGRRLLSMARRWAAPRVGWRGLGLTVAGVRELTDTGTPVGP